MSRTPFAHQKEAMTTPDQKDEMEGLPEAIQRALIAHPEWERIDRETVVCAGIDCDWRKPGGKSTKQAWVRHQTWTLFAAIKEWYFEGEA